MRRRVYQSDPIALERTQLETYGRIALDEAPITLYTRDNTGAIYSDMVSPLGRRVRCSTKASDYETAKRNALEQWRNWTNESVGSILERYTAQILASPNSTTGESSSVSVIRKNLIPFFKTIRIDELNYKHVFQWQEWRKKPKPHYTQNYQRGQNVLTYDFKPKVPKDSTLKREKVYLVQALGWYSYQTDSLLKEGVLKEIRSAHEFQPKSRNSKKQKQEEAGRFRDVFSEDQRRQLIDHLADFEQKYLGAKKHYEKRLTGFYVRLLLTSGMRPGREIGEIKWSNIYNVPIGDGLGIAIRPCGNGKTGPRDVTCFPEAINIIDGLKALLEEFGFSTDGQSYIFLDLPLFHRTVRRLRFELL
jgi:hypothetical protein